MSDIRKARTFLLTRLLEGPATASRDQRRSAFDGSGLSGPVAALIQKVAQCAYKITDDDVASVRSSGLSEDQIFEMVVCAAVGEANRQYETALVALEAAGSKA